MPSSSRSYQHSSSDRHHNNHHSRIDESREPRHRHHHDQHRRQREDDEYNNNNNNNNINNRRHDNHHSDRRVTSSRDDDRHHRHHRDRDRDRDRSRDDDRDRHHRRHDRDRDRDRDSRKHTSSSSSRRDRHDNRDNRDRSERGGTSSNRDKKDAGGENSSRRVIPNRHPNGNYRCHICARADHWTLQCPNLIGDKSFRRFFPHVSVSKGCFGCGKKTSSHDERNCPNEVLACAECAGLHVPLAAAASSSSKNQNSTSSSSLSSPSFKPPAVLAAIASCPFTRQPCTWYEFVDGKTGLPYYVDAEKKKLFEQTRAQKTAELSKKKNELLEKKKKAEKAEREKPKSVFDTLLVSDENDAKTNKEDDGDEENNIKKEDPFAKELAELDHQLLRQKMNDVEEEQKLVTWCPPENPSDVVYWYCEKCSQLLPVEKYRKKCPNCKTARFR